MSHPYNLAWEKFIEEMGESEPDIEVEFDAGWRGCKEAILNILKRDLQNLDLSTDSCDSRYIEQIEKL